MMMHFRVAGPSFNMPRLHRLDVSDATWQATAAALQSRSHINSGFDDLPRPNAR